MAWPTAVISDVCGDDNAKGRVRSRLLYGIESSVYSDPTMISIQSDVEAYLDVLDQIDAFRNSPAILLVNFARRDDNEGGKKNGSPFGHLSFGNKHVFTTVEGRLIPLLQRRLRQQLSVTVYDLVEENLRAIGYPEWQWEYIKETQFRSFEYQPDLGQAF